MGVLAALPQQGLQHLDQWLVHRQQPVQVLQGKLVNTQTLLDMDLHEMHIFETLSFLGVHPH